MSLNNQDLHALLLEFLKLKEQQKNHSYNEKLTEKSPKSSTKPIQSKSSKRALPKGVYLPDLMKLPTRPGGVSRMIEASYEEPESERYTRNVTDKGKVSKAAPTSQTSRRNSIPLSRMKRSPTGNSRRRMPRTTPSEWNSSSAGPLTTLPCVVPSMCRG